MVPARYQYLLVCSSVLAAAHLETPYAHKYNFVTQTAKDFSMYIKAMPGWANVHDPNGADVAGADLNTAGEKKLHFVDVAGADQLRG
jgi:hypothetical protein